MIKRDYIEQLMEEMRQLAERTIGRARNDPMAARREIDAAYLQVGAPALVLDRLDPTSIRMMSGNRVEALVKLLETDAEFSELTGDTVRARRRRLLAQALTDKS